MWFNSYNNVNRYFQFLIFLEFDNTSFQIHDYFLKRYNIRFDRILI